MKLLRRARWLAARLRNMSGPEVLHRLREAARRRAARYLRQGWDAYARHSLGDCPQLPGLGARVATASIMLREHVADAAARFRGGEFEALGVRWPVELVGMPFSEAVWRTDPCSMRTWPGIGHYCFDIPYRLTSEAGDVKHVWEFGRLQFLPLLAADHALNANADSLSAVSRAIDSWHTHNPPFQGVHWAELLNVALRAISVLLALTLCGASLPSATVQRAREMLAAHARLLALFPSLYSSANNHLVAERAAEYLITLAMPDLPQAALHRAQAKAELGREALKQLLPDGVPAEQSPSYGAFTAEFLLLVHEVAAAADEPFAPEVAARLSVFADHVQTLANGRGVVPALCDNDEGRVISSCHHEQDYPMAIAGSIRAVTGQRLKAARRLGPRLRDLFFGEAALAAPDENVQRLCTVGGYSIDRRRVSGRRCILGLDHGPLGYLSIAAHGHADALSVVLDVDDTPVLVDPGTFLYHSGGAWRDWFRSTAAHNTLNLEGADQSRMAGPFNWLSKAEARLDEAAAGPDWTWRASHDGYYRSHGLRHERRVQGQPDGYRITDRLLGQRGTVKAAVVFQVGPALHAQREPSGFLVLRAREPLLRLVFEAAGELRCDRGGDRGAGGWVSPRFGLREAADRIVWAGTVPESGAVVRLHVMPATATAPSAESTTGLSAPGLREGQHMETR